MIVYTNAVIYPWTMTVKGLVIIEGSWRGAAAYWSCFATHLLHLLQCLLLSGIRTIHVTQKF